MLKFAVFVRTPSRCSLLPELNGDHVSLLYTFQNTSVQAIEAARIRQDRASRTSVPGPTTTTRTPRRLRASILLPSVKKRDPAAVGGTRGPRAGCRAPARGAGQPRTHTDSRHAPVHRHREPPRSGDPAPGRREYYGLRSGQRPTVVRESSCSTTTSRLRNRRPDSTSHEGRRTAHSQHRAGRTARRRKHDSNTRNVAGCELAVVTSGSSRVCRQIKTREKL